MVLVVRFVRGWGELACRNNQELVSMEEGAETGSSGYGVSGEPGFLWVTELTEGSVCCSHPIRDVCLICQEGAPVRPMG